MLCFNVLFCPIGHNRTFAEMSDEEKNALSHRGRAFQKLREFLQRAKGIPS
ncbi:MAG: non-canonical purine NTP pyrophosphatase [Patescibacteria group bacterium]